MHPPPSQVWANLTLMMECTPESSRCYSVYSVAASKKAHTMSHGMGSDLSGFMQGTYEEAKGGGEGELQRLNFWWCLVVWMHDWW
jgi:hypothetical protein